MTKKSIFHYALSSLLVGGIALSVTSCADDDINPNQGNDGDALVRFSINDVQEQAVNRGLEMTRGAIANGITAADLAGHKLAAHSNRNIDVCLIETTVEGVNPIKADAHTRANIATAISGDFSSTGIRGVAENSILSTPEWFKAVKTKQNGELYTPIRWSIAQPWARFFAVYPSKDSYSKLTINDMASADNAPSVDFTVEPNVNDQKDFMTACTGKVHYATQGEHPTTSLDFRHALTAIYVHFTDNTEITATLKGEWKAGTTRTLKLSETNSTWQYVLTPTDPSRAANYDETTSQAYGITSYRQAPDGTQQAVAWKVVGYDADGDGIFSMAEKPAWLTSLSKTEGAGGTAADQGTATLRKDVADLLAKRNKELREATALGSASAPYDLSTKNGSVNRSTANCYVISAPGHYRIPLVYGNAIENGVTNSRSYISSAPPTMYTSIYGSADMILHNFKDHNDQNITDPWIEKTNGGANSGVDGAEVVWADAADLVHSPSITHVGGEAFLDFEVKQSDIQSGNAVVAVKKNGTTVWSWHLWFAPKDALDKIPVTNHQGVVYNFTKETLGWKPTQWSGTTYSSARTVKVKVEQTVANNGTKQNAVINITQNPGNVRKGVTTFYQFGRKDAFPGVDASELAANSHFTENAGDNMSIMNGIQHPDNFYSWGSSGSSWKNNYGYYNLWSADNTTTDFNDNSVVKTVYDPSPVGFKMPASNAFTGFTTTGQNSSTQSEFNVDGTSVWQTYQNNFGHNFWTNSSKTATINFPASGYRNISDGSLNFVGLYGFYWSPVPDFTNGGCSVSLASGEVNPLNSYNRAYGFAARPVAE